MQIHAMPGVRVLFARKATRGAEDRRMVRGSAECGSSSSLAPETSGQRERVGRSGSVGGGRQLPYGKVRGDGCRTSGCCEPDIAVSSARRAEPSSDSGRSEKIQERVTYCGKSVSAAAFEVKKPFDVTERLYNKVE